ncbi:MAG: LUD domain-containing protein [Anaerolineae bacterium]|nr:LUD domain-containing protein [Anaerolineae bacterium]
MSSSRDTILSKLRSARRPFDAAPPRPANYLPVLSIEDTGRAALIARFEREMETLKGSALVAQGDDAASAIVIDLLHKHNVTHILAWDFAHIPVADLETKLHEAGITITFPNTHEARSPDTMQWYGSAGAGITGADAAIAATGTLVLSASAGKGRIPTVLPPVWISIINSEQIFARLEEWLAHERTQGLTTIQERSNLVFVTGPSRTGDIEMQLILGVHGPGTQYVVIKQ